MNVMIEFRVWPGLEEEHARLANELLFFGGPHDARRSYFLYGSCNAHLSIKHLIK